MEDLIEALNIFLKYGNPRNPTHCEHDVMHIAMSPDGFSEEDIDRLEELGFMIGDNFGEEDFMSFRFGSA